LFALVGGNDTGKDKVRTALVSSSEDRTTLVDNGEGRDVSGDCLLGGCEGGISLEAELRMMAMEGYLRRQSRRPIMRVRSLWRKSGGPNGRSPLDIKQEDSITGRG